MLESPSEQAASSLRNSKAHARFSASQERRANQQLRVMRLTWCATVILSALWDDGVNMLTIMIGPVPSRTLVF